MILIVGLFSISGVELRYGGLKAFLAGTIDNKLEMTARSSPGPAFANSKTIQHRESLAKIPFKLCWVYRRQMSGGPRHTENGTGHCNYEVDKKRTI